MAEARLKVYQTSHQISKKVCAAFAIGCNGELVSAMDVNLLPGDAAMYGILRGTEEIIKECEDNSRDYYYIDLGYFDRSTHTNNSYMGYYRVTKNANQCNIDKPATNEAVNRWENLNIKMKPWKKDGLSIVVCPLSRFVGEFLGIKPSEWLRQTIDEIVMYTDRPVILKPKDSDQTLAMTLKSAHCIVAYNSNVLVESVLNGIPVFNTGPSCVAPVGLSDLRKIENPITPNRGEWAANLAANQWTLNEMRNGKCWEDLNE